MGEKKKKSQDCFFKFKDLKYFVLFVTQGYGFYISGFRKLSVEACIFKLKT